MCRQRQMVIRGLRLPADFVACIDQGRFNRPMGSWPLVREQDAYGNPLETELGDVYDTEESFVRETNALSADFPVNEWYGDRTLEDEPGSIPDIVDFSQVVCFAISGDGAPFCFDFRDNRDNPSVIWWDDWYWRRIAPDFPTFVSLLDMRLPT